MKRIYRENSNGTKEVIGYDYEGVMIEVNYSESRSYYNPWKKDGYLVKALQPILGWCYFETLKKTKEYIDKYLKK